MKNIPSKSVYSSVEDDLSSSAKCSFFIYGIIHFPELHSITSLFGKEKHLFCKFWSERVDIGKKNVTLQHKCKTGL